MKTKSDRSGGRDFVAIAILTVVELAIEREE